MTVYTQRFEVAWVISAMLGQFENVMAMTLVVFSRLAASLADATITLKYILLEREPQVNSHPAVPRKAQTRQFVNCESCHALPVHTMHNPTQTHRTNTHRAFPDKAIPYPAVPYITHAAYAPYNRALPRQNTPDSARTYIANPSPTSPGITQPHQASSRRALTAYAPYNHTLSCLTRHDQSSPNPTSPDIALHRRAFPGIDLARHARPGHALTTRLILVNVKPNYIESAKARAVISNADSLTCLGQNILQQGMVDSIVNDVDLKTQLPSGRECRTDTNNAVALNDNGTNVKVKRLITIGIEFIRNGKALMRDSFRIDKYIGLEQILITHAALASDLEGYSSLDQRAFNVTGGLVDLPVIVGVKVFAPFLCVIFRASGFVAAFAHRGKIGEWITVLNQRSDTFDLATNGIHGDLLSILKHKAVALRSPISCHRVRCLRKATALYWRIKNAEPCDVSIIALPYM